MNGFRRLDWYRSRRRTCRTGAWLATATFALFLTMAPGAALAQGIFDFLFGQRSPAPPPPPLPSVQPQANQSTDPLGRIRPNESITNSNTGRVVAYCVRLCDGRYFPLEHHAAAQAVQLCSAFCPASPTKVFNGSVIDTALAADGARYADLKTAYLYRKKVVDSCTCNGKDAFGLAAIDL